MLAQGDLTYRRPVSGMGVVTAEDAEGAVAILGVLAGTEET